MPFGYYLNSATTWTLFAESRSARDPGYSFTIYERLYLNSTF